MTRNRRFSVTRISIRTLLATTAILALIFAGTMWQESIRLELIAEIRQLGGSVEFDERNHATLFRGAGVTGVKLPRETLSEISGSRLTVFGNLDHVTLTDVEVGKGSLTHRSLSVSISSPDPEAFRSLDRAFGIHTTR